MKNQPAYSFNINLNNMISFIVIGHNEEKNLKRCFESIFSTLEYNKIKDYEIVYVDSKSTDQSINIAHRFKEIKVFQITGNCNAAIGRNIGANESKGNILFFIDGDMEINKKFLKLVLDKNFNLKYDFVTGEVVDVIDGITHKLRTTNKFLPGGIFLINKQLWLLAQGMKTKFKTGEDLDLGLRISKLGYTMVLKEEVITNHYTKPYLDKSKIWKMVWDKSFFYSRCVLYRDHIFNKQMYHELWLTDKTFILLLFNIACSLIIPQYIVLFISVYLLAVIARSIKQKNFISILKLVWFYIVFDLLNLFFLFTFFPKNKKNNYIEIQNKKIDVDKNVLI